MGSSLIKCATTALNRTHHRENESKSPFSSFLHRVSASLYTNNKWLVEKYYFQEVSIVGLPMRLMYSGNYSSENDSKFQNISNEKAERKISLRKIIIMFPGYRCWFSRLRDWNFDDSRVTEQWVLTEKQVNNLRNSCTKLWALYENRHSNKWCKDRWYMDNR